MSGGTTTVINATLAGILSQVKKSPRFGKIYAGFPGILGALNEDLVDLTNLDDKALALLKTTPGSGFLGTTRITPLSDREIQRLFEVIDAYKIGYFINIGGNGTIKQTKSIADKMGPVDLKIAAAPKTVDNDLGDAEFQKVYFTPGFPSCVRYWVHKLHLLNQESLGACSHDRVLVAQTFGRETGFLSGAPRVGDTERRFPLLLLLPEDQQNLDAVISAIEKTLSQQKRVIVILSEGYQVGDLGQVYDPSGQIMYGSSGTTAAQLLVNHLMKNGIQTRAYIPTVDQRLEIMFTSEMDMNFSYQLGEFIIRSFDEGKTHFLASVSRYHSEQPQMDALPLASINNFSRVMPKRWIWRGAFDVSNDYVDYLRPFLKGPSTHIPIDECIPRFIEPVEPVKRKILDKWETSLCTN